MPLKGLFFVAVLFALGCAQVRPITGGEKDSTPPSLVSSTPPNGTTRFNSDVIHLEFDERIQLDRVRDKLLISPPLASLPVVKINGPRGVDISWEEELQPNTTYTFNLGGAVKDLTEGNAAAGINYVFSTGDALDSLVIRGSVANAFSGAAEKDMLVLLYNAGDTATFRTSRPAYMTRCNGEGAFTITNLPAKTFHAFALRDKNGNYRYDLPNEEIAFLDSVVMPALTDTTAPMLRFRTFLPNSPIQSVRSAKVIPDGALQVILARAADSLLIRDIARTGGSLRWQQEWNLTRDTVLFWPSDTTLLDAGSFELGDGSTALDTVRYRPLQRVPFNTGITASQVDGTSGTRSLLRAKRPIADYDMSRVKLIADSVELPFELVRTEDPRTLLLTTEMGPGTSAALTLLPRTIRDIYGGTNDTVRIALGRAAEKSLGTLRVELKGLDPTGHYLLHLLDPQQRVVQEAVVSDDLHSVKWERLPPGSRTLRLITDRNGNGRWDTGDLDQGLQPERTWYHSEPVNVRAAWDIVVDWKLN